MKKIRLPFLILLLSTYGCMLLQGQSNKSTQDLANSLNYLDSLLPDKTPAHESLLQGIIVTAQTEKDHSAEAKALFLLSKHYGYREVYDSSIIWGKQALKVAQQYHIDTSTVNALIQIADMNDRLGDAVEGIPFLNQSIAICQRLKDTARLMQSYTVLSNLFETNVQMDSALYYAWKVRYLCTQYENKRLRAVNAYGLGTRYYNMVANGKWPKDSIPPAKAFYLEAIDIHKKRKDNKRYAQTLNAYAATLYEEDIKNEQIKPLYLEALRFHKQAKEYSLLLEVVYNLAIYEDEIGERDSAVVYWQMFKDIAKESEKHNDKKYLLQFFLAQRDNVTDSSEVNLSTFFVDFPIREAENNKALDTQKKVTTGLIAGLVSVFLLGGGLVYRNKKRAELADIEASKKQAETDALLKEYENNASRIALDAERETRDKIGRDLHDGPSALIAAGRWSIESAIEKLEQEAHPLAPQLRSSLEMQNKAYIGLRNIIHRTEQDPVSWIGEVATFCGAIPEVKFSAFNMETVPNGNFGRSCQKLVMELVHNARKHSEATSILVELVLIAEENLLSIMVQDNGKGFDKNLIPAPGKKDSNHGLNNLVNNVDDLGGDITFETEKGIGTTVFIEIPLPNLHA